MSCDHAVVTGDPAETGQLAEYLAWDLSGASGVLGEIATCWRRAHDALPGLPLALPLELGEKAALASADIRALASADPARHTELALSAARRIAGLRVACASAASLAQVADAAVAGDRELWESVIGTLCRAGVQSLSILLQVSAVTDWSLEDEPEDGSGTWLRLQIR